MTTDMREVFITQMGELSSDKRYERERCLSLRWGSYLVTRDITEVFITQVGELSSDKRHERGVCHSGGGVI